MKWKVLDAKTQLPYRACLGCCEQLDYHSGRHNRKAPGDQKDDLGWRVIPISVIFDEMVGDRKASLSGENTLAGFWDGWLYFTSGQRDRGPNDPQPRKVIGDMWRTKLNL